MSLLLPAERVRADPTAGVAEAPLRLDELDPPSLLVATWY
jgi:hypothetical protein